MKHSSKSKSSKKSKQSKKTKLTPDQRKAAAKARQQAKKGDGSFPDLLVVSKQTIQLPERKIYQNADEQEVFIGHDGETMNNLNTHGEEVAIYKLRRVSKMKIIRKIER